MNKIAVQKKFFGLAACFLVLLVPYFVMILNHGNNLEMAQSICPFKMLTGFPCPGCGITKSIINVYEGHFLQSVTNHLFGPVVVLFAVFVIFWLMAEIFFQKEFLNHYFFNKKLGIAAGICLGVYHLFRLIVFVNQNNFDSILKQSIWR